MVPFQVCVSADKTREVQKAAINLKRKQREEKKSMFPFSIVFPLRLQLVFSAASSLLNSELKFILFIRQNHESRREARGRWPRKLGPRDFAFQVRLYVYL